MAGPKNPPLDVVPYYIPAILLFLMVVVLFSALLPYKCRKSSKPQLNDTISAFSIDDLLILPGHISHTRLFPKFHSFTYSYLMVGVPIHSAKRGNYLLSVDERSWWKRGWLRVEAKDHLGRDDNEHGIRQKLELYLRSQVWSI